MPDKLMIGYRAPSVLFLYSQYSLCPREGVRQQVSHQELQKLQEKSIRLKTPEQ